VYSYVDVFPYRKGAYDSVETRRLHTNALHTLHYQKLKIAILEMQKPLHSLFNAPTSTNWCGPPEASHRPGGPYRNHLADLLHFPSPVTN
jgi:hypothetical protein